MKTIPYTSNDQISETGTLVVAKNSHNSRYNKGTIYKLFKNTVSNRLFVYNQDVINPTSNDMIIGTVSLFGSPMFYTAYFDIVYMDDKCGECKIKNCLNCENCE